MFGKAALLAAAALALPAPALAATCAAGKWQVAAPDPDDAPNAAMPVRHQTEHFVFRWTGDLVPMKEAQAAGEHLEYVWREFVDRLGFPEPHCETAEKFKVNVFVGADYGLTGGADSRNHMAVWIGPGAMRDRFGLAHEFTHALQSATGALRDSPYTGWLFESHANWMTHQLAEFRTQTHCSVLSVNYPHLYYGSTRVRYCNWQFLEHVKNHFGYSAINGIWERAPRTGPEVGTADPLMVLMRNLGLTVEQMNDLFGDWALHNANWDYVNPDGSDQGQVYRRAYGGYEPQLGDRIRRTTLLEPIDARRRRFAVPEAWAPQRWGYNIVKLVPDAGAKQVRVTFRGIVQDAPATTTLPGLADEPDHIPPPASGWRWGVVAVDAAGKPRYSALQRGADGETTMALEPGDKGLFLLVLGAPTQFQQIRWDQPYYSLYRYPWMVELAGALPAGAPSVAGGKRHANGGGWVAPGASVDTTAYVGPNARVLAGQVREKARVEDQAVVDGGRLSGNARAGALTVIRADTILQDNARADTVFLALGELERGVKLSGSAMNLGDVEQRGAAVDHGVFYGFIDPSILADPARGAKLEARVPEVTAKPVYRWRP